MSFASSNGVRIYWRTDGHPEKPTIVLLNSLGSTMAMWDAAVPYLTANFHVLRMDNRGHGASDAPSGDYSLRDLGADTIAVMDASGTGKAAAVCGLSLGGMIAQWLALHSPERFGTLIACNTSSEMPPDLWDARLRAVKSGGMRVIVDAVMERFFSTSFRQSGSPTVASARAMVLGIDPTGYAGCCAAIRDMNPLLGETISRITLPTLVINGSEDVATPPSHGCLITKRIQGAQLVELPAGHISALETPKAVADAIIRFLQPQAAHSVVAAAQGVLFQHGLAIRREVLGDAWVDKSLTARNAFSGEFQELITRGVWSEIWGRPGLDRRTRRLLVLTATIALGRWEEFRLHVRAGLEQTGFTLEELRETIMQSGAYAGVPAANTAFHHANEIVAEFDGANGSGNPTVKG